MSGKKYDVLITGKLVEGAVLDQVKANVAKLFKTDISKIERLFIGQPVMIKKGVDEETARKYMTAMKKAGAICEVKECATAPTTPSPAQATAQNTPPSPKPTLASSAAHSKSEAEIAAGEDGEMRFVMKQAPQGLGELADASVDAPGTTLVEHQDIPPPQIDTSGLSVDRSNADLVKREEPPLVNVDVSGLSLDEPDARIGEEREVPELDVDLSGLTLDEPGVTLVEPEKPEKPDIDTSNLKLSND